MKKMTLGVALLTVFALALGAQATTYYWDGTANVTLGSSDNTNTAAQSWLSDGLWDDGATSAALVSWTAGDNAIFGGGALSQTITAGTFTVGNLTFGSGATGSGTSGTAYTITSGTITLQSTTITANTATTIGSILTGASTLTKAGSANLTLSGANTYTGNTTISGGTLTLTGTGGIYTGGTKSGANSLVINGGGVLVGDRWDWAVGQSLGMLNFNTGNIAVDNGTIRNTAAASTYMGSSTISRGIAVGSGGMTLENATSATTWTWVGIGGNNNTYANNAVLTLTGAGNGALAQTVDGTGVSIVKDGAGTWTLSGINTYTGSTTIKGGNGTTIKPPR